MKQIGQNTIKYGIYGLCIADAAGAPAEFKSREFLKKKPITTMIGLKT